MTDPGTSPTGGLGREYGFWTICRLGWRQMGTVAGSAIAMVAAVSGILLALGLLSFVAMIILIGATSRADDTASAVIGFGVLIVVSIGGSLIALMLADGYLWSAVTSFDEGRMTWRRVTDPWRRPWLGRMISLAIIRMVIAAVAATAPIVGMAMVMASRVGRAMGAGQVLLVFASIAAMSILPAMVVLVGTLLVGPIIMSSRTPSLWRAWAQYLHILREQPRRVLGLIGVVLGGFVFVALLPVFVWPVALFILAFPVAALYRATHGLAVERVTHWAPIRAVDESAPTQPVPGSDAVVDMSPIRKPPEEPTQ